MFLISPRETKPIVAEKAFLTLFSISVLTSLNVLPVAEIGEVNAYIKEPSLFIFCFKILLLLDMILFPETPPFKTKIISSPTSNI